MLAASVCLKGRMLKKSKSIVHAYTKRLNAEKMKPLHFPPVLHPARHELRFVAKGTQNTKDLVHKHKVYVTWS